MALVMGHRGPGSPETRVVPAYWAHGPGNFAFLELFRIFIFPMHRCYFGGFVKTHLHFGLG